MATGLAMMLKSLGLDPKIMEQVAQAVQNAAADLHTIKEQQMEILRRLDAMEPSNDDEQAKELMDMAISRETMT